MIGDTLPLFLYKNKFHDWYLTPQTGEYLPKFMARPNSWGYSFTEDGKPGRGLLLHDNAYQEPSPEMKELAMGYPRGSTSAIGITTSMRHKILGACQDSNIVHPKRMPPAVGPTWPSRSTTAAIEITTASIM